ncbi:MAG: LysR substrate-binding domain-containing protein [Thalassovita sp.]
MVSKRIRMRHLRCFLAVADLGSVTRAAERMGTVQPSVSRSIRELEEELGATLFERTSTGLAMNAAGRLLYSYVDGGLEQVDLGLKTMRGQIVEQRVSAYVLPNVVRMVMPGATARFKSLYPSIDVEFKATTGGGLHHHLRLGDADFSFGRIQSAEEMQGLNFEHLFSEPLVFFVRRDHPLVSDPNLTIHDINEFPVVIPLANTIIRDELERFIIGKGLSRFSNRIETISFEFARNFILVSDAIVFLPVGGMKRELSEGTVTTLNYCKDELMGAVGLTTPTARKVSEPAQLLMQVIREEVQALGLGT